MVEHDTMQIHEFLIHWVPGVQTARISPIQNTRKPLGREMSDIQNTSIAQQNNIYCKIVTKVKPTMFFLWSVSHNHLFLPIVKKFFQIWTFLKCPKMSKVAKT